MTENLPQNVEKTLQILAERFGTTVEHLWAVAVRQTYIEAGTAAISIVLTVFITAILISAFNSMADDEDTGDAKKATMAFLTCITAFIAIIVVLSNINEILQVFNPEFYAVKLLLSTLK